MSPVQHLVTRLLSCQESDERILTMRLSANKYQGIASSPGVYLGAALVQTAAVALFKENKVTPLNSPIKIVQTWRNT